MPAMARKAVKGKMDLMALAPSLPGAISGLTAKSRAVAGHMGKKGWWRPCESGSPFSSN